MSQAELCGVSDHGQPQKSNAPCATRTPRLVVSVTQLSWRKRAVWLSVRAPWRVALSRAVAGRAQEVSGWEGTREVRRIRSRFWNLLEVASGSKTKHCPQRRTFLIPLSVKDSFKTRA